MSSKHRVVQIVASLQQGDAVGNETFALHELFRKQSIANEIVYLNHKGKVFEKKYSMTGKHIANFKIMASDLLIIHESMGNPKLKSLRKLPNKKINRYHNITPGKYFQRYNVNLARDGLEYGRREIMNASGHYDLAIADSKFNAAELKSGGYKKIEIIPVFIPFQRFSKVKELHHTSHDKKRKRILFVGRLVPNKKIEDLINLFYLYNKKINKNSELIIIGQAHIELYFTELTTLIQSLKLESKVLFKKFVSDSELAKLFSESDIFITMSEHEGFCVPVVEAMYMGLPVMARADTATGETLGNSGIRIHSLQYDVLAETIHEVLSNKNFHNTLIEDQYKQLNSFSHEKIEQMWLDSLAKFL